MDDLVKKLYEGAGQWNHQRWSHPHEHIDLDRSMLSDLYLGVNLKSIDFSAVDLQSIRDRGVDLSCASLRSVNLAYATLPGADLRGSCLAHANLRFCYLRWAQLCAADLRNANLCGAYLYEADLSDIILTDAICDKHTVWPGGFDWRDSGVIQVDDLNKEVDLTITFSPDLSKDQIKVALESLADYYRACGGVGFRIDFNLQTVAVESLVYA